MDSFRQLFMSGNFQPRGYCYQWDKGLVWLNVVSDALIAFAYFTIPFTLLWFIRKRRDRVCRDRRGPGHRTTNCPPPRWKNLGGERGWPGCDVLFHNGRGGLLWSSYEQQGDIARRR